MKELTKEEAQWLLTAVVDNEATDVEKRAFFLYIEHDSEVYNEYKQTLLLKKAISVANLRVKAPDHLRKSISESLDHLRDLSDTDTDLNLAQAVGNTSFTDIQTTKTLRYLTAAAVILFISLVTLQLLDRTTGTLSNPLELIIENTAAEYFINTGGQLVEPHYSTNLHREGESYLLDQYGMRMTIPHINGAEFSGILHAEFVDGFHTPLLVYHQNEIGEIIFLFAFELGKVQQHKSLVRHGEAAKNCIGKEDFYVVEIYERHVVSWLWDNIWYTAISNHNGYDLASLVGPLNYTR